MQTYFVLHHVVVMLFVALEGNSSIRGVNAHDYAQYEKFTECSIWDVTRLKDNHYISAISVESE